MRNHCVLTFLAIMLCATASGICQPSSRPSGLKKGQTRPTATNRPAEKRSENGDTETHAASEPAKESRIVLVVDSRAKDERTREVVLVSVIDSVWGLSNSDGERFVVLWAGENEPVAVPKASFSVPDLQTKRAIHRLLDPLKPVAKPDLLAAVKRAYALIEADVRPGGAPTGVIKLLCLTDPPKQVADFIREKSRHSRPPLVEVRVLLFGKPDIECPNAERIALDATAKEHMPSVAVKDLEPSTRPAGVPAPPIFRTSTGLNLAAGGTTHFLTVPTPWRFAYLIDTRVTDGVLKQWRPEIRRSMACLRPLSRFVIVAAGEGQPRVGPGETFTPPTSEARTVADRWMASLRPVAKGDLLAAVKRTYELCETASDKDFLDPPTKIVYLFCLADPPKEVAEFIETKRSDARDGIHVNIFIWGKDGMAHPNATRMAKASHGSVRIITPEPVTQPAASPAAMPAKSQPAGATSGQ